METPASLSNSAAAATIIQRAFRIAQKRIASDQADLAAIIIIIDLLVSVLTTHFFVKSKQKIGVAPGDDEQHEEMQDLITEDGLEDLDDDVQNKSQLS